MNKIQVAIMIALVFSPFQKSRAAISNEISLSQAIVCTERRSEEMGRSSAIYPVGFGADRYFGYLSESDSTNLIIVDLITDKLVAEIPVKREGQKLLVSEDARTELEKRGVVPSNTIRIESFPLKANHDQYDAEYYRSSGGFTGAGASDKAIYQVELTLVSKNKGRKRIAEYEDRFFDESIVRGLLRTPDENRIAVVSSNLSIGSGSGELVECKVSIHGANLRIGFDGVPPNKSLKSTNPAQGGR